ncbi:hypothetical protein ROZALSC1DRAFT_26885 [Rozella allomycis CSF55]|uniref:Lipoxygenase, LH2 domain-containing protein n=1 Tax=Rozella allomycis (strain CSF55) TaxID=988480 RepID=A0A075AZG9_ROZAC|nr:Lipoxygenase, LH2 domain-containing protein [Rozella allomycis CSF55]RKP21723.1 hypothetical protein ROZALSC1DRAFT_26885 [Rozella allomycis CSF55]|eukprot:EPZ35544.1 Lipoxygenase, LH2 domain-containing protein [Rozella allomycis CSF55]
MDKVSGFLVQFENNSNLVDLQILSKDQIDNIFKFKNFLIGRDYSGIYFTRFQRLWIPISSPVVSQNNIQLVNPNVSVQLFQNVSGIQRLFEHSTNFSYYANSQAYVLSFSLTPNTDLKIQTIDIVFSDSVSDGSNLNKAGIDDKLSCNQILGSSYNGVWQFQQLHLDALGLTLALVSFLCQGLNPLIVSLTASNPNRDFVVGVGDTLTIQFSAPTDVGITSGGALYSKTLVDSLFSFSTQLGSDYQGYWSNDGTNFTLTILAASSNVFTFDNSQFMVAVIDDIKIATGLSYSARGTFYRGLSGSFINGICRSPVLTANVVTGESTFTRSQDISLSASIVSDLRLYCPTATSFNYTWNISGPTQSNTNSLTFNGQFIKISRSTLRTLNVGLITFTSTLVMNHPDGTINGSANVTVTLNASPIIVRLRDGNSRLASSAVPMTIDARSSTLDPDDPCSLVCFDCQSCATCTSCISKNTNSTSQDNVPFVFTWSCLNLTDTAVCPSLFNSSTNTPYLQFPANVYSPGNYLISFSALKNPSQRTGSTSLILQIQSGSVPDVSIKAPDVAKLNPSLMNTFMGSASLPYATTFTYTWSMSLVSSNATLNLTDLLISPTGNNKRNLAINPNTLAPYSTYKLRLDVVGASNEQGFSEITFSVNGPPTLGSCQVDPQTGFDLNTTYTISCNGWYDSDSPLSYLFLSKKSATDPFVPLIQSPTTNSSLSALLSAGNSQNNFTIFLSVYIYDSLGAFSSVTLNATVKSFAEADSAAALAAASTLINSDLASLAKQGKSDQVMQTASVLTSILNTASPSQNSDTGALRGQIIDLIVASNDASVASSAAVQQSVSLIKEVTSSSDQISPEAQASAASFLKSLSDNVKSNGVEPSTGATFLNAFDNILGAATSNNSQSDSSSASNSATLSSIVNSVGNIASGLLVNQVVGGDKIQVVSSSITIAAQVHDETTFNGNFTSSGTGGIGNLDTSLITGGGSNVEFEAKLIVMTTNPFSYSPSSANQPGGNEIAVNDTTGNTCILITLPFTNPKGRNTTFNNGTTTIGLQKWSSDGCKFMPLLSTDNTTVCCCSHLTYFGIDIGNPLDFYVPINQIDFIKDAEQLLNLQTDPLLGYVFGATYLVYILLSFWAYRADKADAAKTRASKTKALFTTIYLIRIKTGDVKKAGTDAKVYISFQGEKGKVDKHYLKGSLFRNEFERNQIDSFSLNYIDIGDISRIGLRHDNSGFHADWFVEYIEIMNCTTGDVYKFKCDKWIDHQKEDEFELSEKTTDTDLKLKERLPGVFTFTLQNEVR